MPFNLGPVELGLILVIVAMLFGVGKLPEVFGSIGKGVREFRKESGLDSDKETDKDAAPEAQTQATAASAGASSATTENQG